MRRARLYVASLLMAIVTAAPTWPPGPPDIDDTIAEVEQALDQGRHWYAAQLLRKLNGAALATPEGVLLAARADAGRNAWRHVVRRLAGAAWVDSLDGGIGRALLARGRLETGQYGRAVTDYMVFLGYSVERQPRALAEIGLARSLDALGRADEAAAAYMRAAQAVPDLRPWSAVRAAESLTATGDTATVRALLEEATAVPFSRRTDAVAAAYEAAGDYTGAARVLQAAASSGNAGSHAGALRAQAATLLLEEGDTAAAARALRTAVRSQPRGSRDAAELLSGLPDLSADDHLKLAEAFDRSGAPRQAAAEYGKYLEMKDVSRSERQRLQLKIGELLFRGGSNYASIRTLQALVESEPDRATLSRAEYYIARATYRRGWRREGRAQLRAVADNHPGSASALRALSLLGDLYESAGTIAQARAIYEELVADYGGTSTARKARYRLGILAYMDGDYEGARSYFDRLRRSGRRDDYQLGSTYWAARARDALGEDQASEAERLFRETHSRDPYGYYGLLAAERVAIDPWGPLQPGPEATPVDDETFDALRLIDLLKRGGLVEEADAVFDAIMSSRPKEAEGMLGFSAALLEHGYGQEAVRVGWSVHARLRGRWSASVLRAIYPLNFEEIIQAEADSLNVDPIVVAAIVRQESAYSPHVVSRAGARGLLQIMPATGRWWAGRLKIRDYDIDLLFHPEINVHMGAAYFADLLRRYEDFQLSLIAYNAGPTRARRWRERPEYAIDPEIFVERIPFNETRNYVRGVQRQVRIYRHLYGGEYLGQASNNRPDSDSERRVDRPN
jgi:soluble lytic murein transglycosylase